MLRVDVNGQLNALQRLKLLRMPPAKRRRLLNLMGNQVRKSSRARIRQQKNINGQPWAPRKDGRRKMLRGLGKDLRVYASDKSVSVTYANRLTGSIAKAQQEGITETFTAEQAAKKYGEPDYNAPATTKQARALKEQGFTVKRKTGKGRKKATQKWIKQNLTLGQAGAILRDMRDRESKKSWVIKLPPRAFLGASASDVKQYVQTIFNETLNARA